MARRKFTPVEASRTLPLVRRIVTDLLERGRELRQLAPRHAEPEVRARLSSIEAQIRDLIEELHEIGCDYKDFAFDKGLVDFPGVIDGRPVLWCWRSDEPRVEWYHPPDAGFAGRVRIPSALLHDDAPSAR